MRGERGVLLVVLLSAALGANAANFTLWVHGRGTGGQPGNYQDFTGWGPATVNVGVNKKAVNWDRYSRISETGASIDLLDSTNTFLGWKTKFSQPGAWVQYNSVDFGSKKFKTATINASSSTGGIVEVRLNTLNGPVVAEWKVAKNEKFATINSTTSKIKSGVQNIFIVMKGSGDVEVDWIAFE